MFCTIFTPTYNRAYILSHAYESLQKQDFRDFLWLIIDDGSIDDTESLVQQWVKDSLLQIKYVKQENQGRFAAYNTATKYFEGELVIPLDSDDYLLPDALQKIYTCWTGYQNRLQVSGIIAYIENEKNEIMGSFFPCNIKKERVYTLYDKYHMTGDKFQAYRVDLARKYCYTIYPGEKFTGDNIIFNLINDEYPMLLLTEKILHREYIGDGLTNNLHKHHAGSPNGMADYYLNLISREKYDKIKIIKHYTGYICFSKFAQRRKIITCSPNKILTVLLYIPGLLLLYFQYRKEYFRYKNNTKSNT